MLDFIIARRRLLSVLATLCLYVAAFPTSVSAQSRNATLRVTVVDPSGGVIVGATVTVTGVEPTTRSVQVAPVQTSDAGIAVVAGLAPGRYAVAAEFPGFQTRTLPDVRVRSGREPSVGDAGHRKA